MGIAEDEISHFSLSTNLEIQERRPPLKARFANRRRCSNCRQALLQGHPCPIGMIIHDLAMVRNAFLQDTLKTSHRRCRIGKE